MLLFHYQIMNLQNVWKVQGRGLVQQTNCFIDSYWNTLEKYQGNNWLYRMVGYQYFINCLQKDRENDFQLPFLEKKLSHLTLSICLVNTIPKIFVPIYQEQTLQKLFRESIERFTLIRKWRENVDLKNLLIEFIMQHSVTDFLIILFIRSMVYWYIQEFENQFEEHPHLNKLRLYSQAAEFDLYPFIACATQTKLSFYIRKADGYLQRFQNKLVKHYMKEIHILKEDNNFFLLVSKKQMVSSYSKLKNFTEIIKQNRQKENLPYSQSNQKRIGQMHQNVGEIEIHKKYQTNNHKQESNSTYLINAKKSKTNPTYNQAIMLPVINYDAKNEERLYANEKMVPLKKYKMKNKNQMQKRFLEGYKQMCDFCGLKFQSKNNAIFCGAECQYRYYRKDKQNNKKDRLLLLQLIKYRK